MVVHGGRPSAATNLAPGDTNGRQDVFVREWTLNMASRVSVATDGTQGDFNSSSSALSGDGRYVADTAGHASARRTATMFRNLLPPEARPGFQTVTRPATLDDTLATAICRRESLPTFDLLRRPASCTYRITRPVGRKSTSDKARAVAFESFSSDEPNLRRGPHRGARMGPSSCGISHGPR